MGGQEGIARDLRSHLAIAQDEMRQHGEHGFTCRALYPPDGQSTQPDAPIMGVTRQASASLTGRLVGELKAKGHHESEDTLEKRLAIVKQLIVGGFIVEIDGDGAVFSRRFGGCAHVSPPGHQVSSADETRWGEHVAITRPL
jgi:hypothetical protein